METLVVLAVVVVALLALFSVGVGGTLPATTPATKPELALLPPGAPPFLVDLNILALKAEVTMNACEINLRQHQLHHEAEGARQMRAAVSQLLEATRNGQ